MNNISRLDIAMQNMMPLESGKPVCQRGRKSGALIQRKRLFTGDDAGQRPGPISFRRPGQTAEFIVRKIRNGVEAPVRLYENPHAGKPVLRRNRLEEFVPRNSRS